MPLLFARQAAALAPLARQLQDNDYSSESLLLTDANQSGELGMGIVCNIYFL